MIVPAFDWADFVAPLDPWVVAMAVILGIVLGALAYRLGHRPVATHLFWQLAGGVVFFVPLALMRAFQESQVWERFLATLILWAVFCAGSAIGGRRR